MCMCCISFLSCRSMAHVEFEIINLENVPVGRIAKQWGGIAREVFTRADIWGLKYAPDMSLDTKTVLLAAVFLIVSKQTFLYYFRIMFVKFFFLPLVFFHCRIFNISSGNERVISISDDDQNVSIDRNFIQLDIICNCVQCIIFNFIPIFNHRFCDKTVSKLLQSFVNTKYYSQPRFYSIS